MNWIERLAREHGTGGFQTLEDMVRFGKAVAATEREACAKVAEEFEDDMGYGKAQMIADKIRIRTNSS